jgi:hypothetical protein
VDLLHVPSHAVSGKGDSAVAAIPVTIREVGSPMLPMWPSYYVDCLGVVYVMDTAQPLGLSGALMELLEILSHPALSGKPVLLVLNKW